MEGSGKSLEVWKSLEVLEVVGSRWKSLESVEVVEVVEVVELNVVEG